VYSDLSKICTTEDATINQVVALMDQHRLGIVLVVDEASRLLGTVTDGDIRRAILGAIDFREPLKTLLERKAGSPHAKPISAPAWADRGTCLRLLQAHRILQLPLLDEDGRVAGLVTRDDFLPDEVLPLQAVVMAGGAGMRLRPLTDDVPKPMLPVGGRPLMERIIERLKQAGIRRVNVMTHYKPEKIIEYFRDGDAFGVELTYVREGQPLGTGGALGLMPVPKEPLLVINGDILTGVDFRAMLAFHQENRAEMTVAVGRHDLQVPYGVIECEGSQVRRLTEKPTLHLLVNCGIYLLEPSVYAYVRNGRFDMTDLIQALLDAERCIAGFPIREYWLDIGAQDDYRQAEADVKKGMMD